MSTKERTHEPRSLMRLSASALDELYGESGPGPIPVGDTRGYALVLPGNAIGRLVTWLISLLVWRGKVFDPVDRDLKNKVSPLSVRAIRAAVYEDASWMDQKPTIVIDYSKTSFLAQKIRDEIREVSPGVYLGKVWWGKRQVLHFLLTA